MHRKSWENGFGLIYEKKFSENCGKLYVNVKNNLLLIQRAGIFAQTGLSYVIKFDNEAIFHCKHAKGILHSENKFCLDPRRLKWRLVGLTCNACSYRDNAGRVESKATPVNVFIKDLSRPGSPSPNHQMENSTEPDLVQIKSSKNELF